MKTYIEHSKFVQSHLTLIQIQEMWNDAVFLQLRPAKLTTIKRWLNNGPSTKNENFEPWIVGLSQMLQGKFKPVNINLSVEQKLKKLISEATLTTREQAVVMSLDAFVGISPLSRKQTHLLDGMFDQKFI